MEWCGMVKLGPTPCPSPAHTFLLGGYSQRFGTSTKNFWKYNYDTKNFVWSHHYLR